MSAATTVTLPAQDLSRLQEVIELAASADLPWDAVRVHVLDRLRRLLGADRAIFFLAGPDGSVADPVSVKVDVVWLDRFQTRFAREDPFLKAIPRGVVVIRREDLPDSTRFFHSAFYNDFWRPQSIYHKLCIVLSSRGQFVGAVGLMRSRQETAFGEREVHLARLVAPTLALAGYDALRKEREEARREGRLVGIGVASYVEITGVLL